MTAGQISGLASLIHLTKKAILSLVPFDVSIQATGMPNQECENTCLSPIPSVTTTSFKHQCLDYFCVNDTIGAFGFLLLVLVIDGRVEVPTLQIP